MPAKKTEAAKDEAPTEGVHLAAEHPARVDDYPTRTYRQAMTADQKAVLEQEGLLR